MRAILAITVAGSLVGVLPAQTPNDLGFTRGFTTSYTDRCGANTIVADVLNHFDGRDYRDWVLDPADPTGATFKFNTMKFVVQDQVGTTSESFTVVGYHEDPANPDFPDGGANGRWFTGGPFTLPASTNTGPVAWLYTITFPAMPQAPKGDKWLGVGLTLPASGNWPADGTSVHVTWDRTAASATTTNLDLPGQGANTISNGQIVCYMPTPGGVPAGPATYPSPTAGNRRQIRLEVGANIAGGVCVTQTNQTGYPSSNPGAPNSTPLGGTTNFLSGLNPDLYDFSLSSTPRADDVGFLVTDGSVPSSAVFVIVAFGPSPVGSVPLSTLTPAVAHPNTKGNVCIDFAFGTTFLGISDGTGVFQFMLTLTPAIRTLIQGLSPIDLWYQGFVLNSSAGGPPFEVHATGCGIQHL